MPVRRILRMGHPQLRRVAEPVAEDFIGSAAMDALLTDMVDTLRDYGGIGLAAPQIDVPLRLAIIEIPGGASVNGPVDPMPLTTFINPRVEILAPEPAGYWEGCLSVPGLRGFVERPQHIRVHFTKDNGEQAELTLQGFWATVFQHEFDHLDGVLYIDRITDPAKLAFEDEFARYWQDPAG